MRVSIYSIRDAVVREYNTPFTAANDPTALRMFVNAGRKPDSGFAMNPGDYELYRIGEFDTESGEVFHTDHQRLAKLVDILPPSDGE